MDPFSPSADGASKSYSLVAATPQPPLTHNVMRVADEKFDLKKMVAPIRMVREKPEPRRRREEPAEADEGGDAAKTEGADGKAADGKEKLDTTTVAPWGNAVRNRQKRFQKKTKIYTLSRDPTADDNPDGPQQRRYVRDPDKYPYLLSDFESTTQYTGELHGQDDSYMLFAVQGDQLKAIPVAKWYKFQPKPKYRTLSAEEAAEMMKKQSRKRLDTWVMHKKPKTEAEASVKVEGAETEPKEEKAYMQKLLGVQEPQRRGRDARDRKDDDAAEMDFEEEFADDEDIRFGMEDEEDEKEARNRQYGSLGKRSGFLDDEDVDEEEREEKQRSKAELAVGKKLKRALKKTDQADEIHQSEEENPYISDVEDSEDDDTPPELPEVKVEPGLKRKEGEIHGIAPGKATQLLKGQGNVSPAMSSPEYSAQIGRKRPQGPSPKHPGNLGKASSPLGRAGSTSPPSGVSPMGGSKLGKKRKGPGSDDEKADKKARTDIRPISTGSATELLKHLSGRAASPPHPDGAGRPPSIRAKAPIGRPKGSSSSPRVTPRHEGSAMGQASSQSAGRSTPLSTGASSGKRKAPADSTGTSKKRKTPQSSPRTGAAAPAAGHRPLTNNDITAAFRNSQKEQMDLKELLSEVQKVAGPRPMTDLRTMVAPLIRNLCKVTPQGPGKAIVVTLKEPLPSPPPPPTLPV